MGKSIPVTLGERTFPSKGRAIEFLQQLRDQVPFGQKVPREHNGILLALLSRHQKSEVKIGAGIRHFIVDKAPEWPTACFWIVRVDGSVAKFSFKECITPTGSLAQFREACRTEVWKQTEAFARLSFPDRSELQTCPLSKQSFG